MLKMLCILQQATNEMGLVNKDYLEFLIQGLQRLLKRNEDKNGNSMLIKKKFYLQAADSFMKIENYQMAREMIENCCSDPSSQASGNLISKGDQDEMLVYFLAFKLHCLKNEKDEALEMFELMQ